MLLFFGKTGHIAQQCWFTRSKIVMNDLFHIFITVGSFKALIARILPLVNRNQEKKLNKFNYLSR